MEAFLSIMKTLILLIMVIFIAHISLKFMNGYMSKQNKMIKILERVVVNKSSSLSIVKICDKYYLMSFTEKDNRILKKLDEEEIGEMLSEIEDQRIDMVGKFTTGLRKLPKKDKRTIDGYWNEGKN